MLPNIADKIRTKLRQLVENRVAVSSDAAIFETTLIREGMYCGRRFSLADFDIVYFVEERQIKFYNAAGQLESSCSLDRFFEESESVRRAA